MLSGSILRKIKRRRRRRPKAWRPPPLTIEQVLAWADEHHARTGRWPIASSGRIPGADGTKWVNVDAALTRGNRGLPKGRSLATLLQEKRGVRNRRDLPDLSIAEILRWADAYHATHADWPKPNSGPIPGSRNDTWRSIECALRAAGRGIPAPTSLARILAIHRDRRNPNGLPPFTVEQILAWADEWCAEFGTWPERKSGPIPYAPGETWGAVHAALSEGCRGMPGGDTLTALLVRHRGVRSAKHRPNFDLQQLLAWGDRHRRRTGRWPSTNSGIIPGSDGDTWQTIESALRKGDRGLPGGSSLARFWEEHRGHRNSKDLPPYTIAQILEWADRWHRDFGSWPGVESGAITYASGETWNAVDSALRQGRRGLPGGDSLPRLLVRERGSRNIRHRPNLQTDQILAWAEEFHRRHGKPPTLRSGSIPHSDGDTWVAVDTALRVGRRGLPGGSSLSKLLKAHQSALLSA